MSETHGFSHCAFYFLHTFLPWISAKTDTFPEFTRHSLMEGGVFLDVKEKQKKCEIALFTEVCVILQCFKPIFLINSILIMWTIYLIWFWVTSAGVIVSSSSISFLLTTEKIKQYVKIPHFQYLVISRRILGYFLSISWLFWIEHYWTCLSRYLCIRV